MGEKEKRRRRGVGRGGEREVNLKEMRKKGGEKKEKVKERSRREGEVRKGRRQGKNEMKGMETKKIRG